MFWAQSNQQNQTRQSSNTTTSGPEKWDASVSLQPVVFVIIKFLEGQCSQAGSALVCGLVGPRLES
jgi:hypothetical protein